MSADQQRSVVQFGDAGMGVLPPGFMSASFPVWNVMEGGGFPNFITPAGSGPPNVTSMLLLDIYNWTATRFPGHTFSQTSSAYDWNQAFFRKTQIIDESSVIGSQDKVDWHNAMVSQYLPAAVRADHAPNYREFVGPGDFHCIIGGDRFWWADSGDGVPVHLKLHELVFGGGLPSVSSAYCTDKDPNYCKQGVDLRTTLAFI